MANKKTEGTTELAILAKTPETVALLTAVPQLREFAIWNIDEEDKAELIEELAPSATKGRLSLPRVKMPSGGMMAFSMPDGSVAQEIEGIILATKDVRTYYKDSSTLGTPPDCASEDCVRGFGKRNDEATRPAFAECAKCRLAMWGSAENGVGQACTQRKLAMILTKRDLLPLLLSIPPTSIDAAEQFIRSVASGYHKPVSNMIVRIFLQEKQNQSRIKYGVLGFEVLSELADEAKGEMRRMKKQAQEWLAMIPAAFAEEDAEAEVEGGFEDGEEGS